MRDWCMTKETCLLNKVLGQFNNGKLKRFRPHENNFEIYDRYGTSSNEAKQALNV